MASEPFLILDEAEGLPTGFFDNISAMRGEATFTSGPVSWWPETMPGEDIVGHLLKIKREFEAAVDSSFGIPEHLFRGDGGSYSGARIAEAGFVIKKIE